MEPTVAEIAEARELVRRELSQMVPSLRREWKRQRLVTAYWTHFRHRGKPARRAGRWAAWRQEVSLQLDGVIPPRLLPRVEIFPDRVHCDWCADRRCLMCAKARDLWAGEWAVWMAAIREHGRPAQLAFADWLEEQGYDEATVVEWRTKEV